MMMNAPQQQSGNSLEMNRVFLLCKSGEWARVQNIVRANPIVAVTPMIMPNNISTTILHQVISSKSNDTNGRRALVLSILEVAPDAVMVKNGYGSLPLHVILQRNTKMDSTTKEELALAMMQANMDALLMEGGPGRRTPLHIAFTDYISPELARFMIQNSVAATSMKDKNGWLPIHVACSRHCSPEKLQMLLDANPSSLLEVTGDGESLLHLALKCATKSHPNYALIEKLQLEFKRVESTTDPKVFASLSSCTPRAEAKVRKSPSFGSKRKSSRRRRQVQPTPEVQDTAAVDLLMHFHRNVSQESPMSPTSYAEV